MQRIAAGQYSPAGCGGKVDTDLPATTIDVPDVYFSRLRVRGAATDPTTPIRQIELWVDGERVAGVNQDGGKYDLDWFGSTKLKYGKHTVELRGLDEAFNVGRATKIVTRVNPASPNAPRIVSPRLAFNAKPVSAGRKIFISSRTRAAVGAAEKPRGRLYVFIDRKVGKKWKRSGRLSKSIKRSTRVTYVPRSKGTWRIHGKLRLDAPYKNVRTKYFVIKVR
jgi:hypothetical protein